MGTKRAIRVIWSVLVGAVLVISVGLVAAAVVVPRVAGAVPYTVLTGSMRPSYPPGSLVVVRPVDVADLRVGDVITYQLRSGEPAVVTHRVVGIDVVDGEVRLRTQGDANEAPDREPVRAAQVRGQAWYSIPYVGHLAQATDGRARSIGARVIGGLLLAYAAYLLVSGHRPRRRGA